MQSRNLSFKANHCWPILFVFLTSFLSAWLRYNSIKSYGLGLDDVDHLRLSRGSNLWQIIQNSYTDAHPPLRNILLHLILSIFPPDFTAYRLVSLLPSILIGPVFYFLTLYCSRSHLAAACGTLVLSFGISFISNGHNTRPYSLGLLLLLTHIFCYFKYYRNCQNKAALWFLLISGLLLILTNYGVIAIIIALMISAASNFVCKHKYDAALKISAAYLIIIFVFLAQIFLVYKQSQYRPENVEYLSEYINLKISEIPGVIANLLSFHLSNLNPNSAYVPLIFLFSIVGLITIKEWLLVCLAILPLFGLSLMSYLGLFPLSASRHSIYFSILPLFIICFFIGKLNKSGLFYKQTIALLSAIVLICGLWSDSFLKPQITKIRLSPSIYEYGPANKELDSLNRMIDQEYELPSVILTGRHTERVLKENLNSSGLRGYNSPNGGRVECSFDGYRLMSKRGFDLCYQKISEIYQQELQNTIFLLPLIQFDPRLLSSDRISILHQESMWGPQIYSLVLKFNTPAVITPEAK